MIRPLPRTVALARCLVTLLLVSDAAAQSAPAPPAARPIPGITAPDLFPNACVDCHTVYPERGLDVRLSVLLGRWREGVEPRLLALARATAPAGVRITGRHPDASEALASIPDGCRRCHDRQAQEAPALAELLHSIHLTGGVENHFVTVFQGECTHCHKLAPATGRWSIPSRPEAQAGGASPSSR